MRIVTKVTVNVAIMSAERRRRTTAAAYDRLSRPTDRRNWIFATRASSLGAEISSGPVGESFGSPAAAICNEAASDEANRKQTPLLLAGEMFFTCYVVARFSLTTVR